MFNNIFDGFIDKFIAAGDVVIQSIDKFSFEACLLVGLVSLILAVFGYKKGKHIALISPAVYVILQIFLEVWFGA